MAIADTTPEARAELARLQERITWGDPGPGHVVREILPADYPAYVRILQPFACVDDETRLRSWASMAADIGIELHGETSHRTLAKADPGPKRQWLTSTGRLESRTQRALASVLAAVPGASDVCFGFTESALMAMIYEPVVVTAPLAELEDVQQKLRAEEQITDGPEYWWPRDHAWVVYSSHDLASTYVACSEDVAQAIVAHPDIEALRVASDMRIDDASDAG